MPRTRERRRPGFTLIELLIVIIVIGILISLLIPAIFGAIKAANDAAVIAEETNIGNALSAFKEKYGSFPPSRIMLNETLPFQQYGSISGSTAMGGEPGAFWATTNAAPPASVTDTTGTNDISIQQLAQRSGNYMLKFFPRARMPQNLTTGAIWNDFNGNGVPDHNGTFGAATQGWIYLEGHECLVFFLGGIANITKSASGSKTAAMTGFGRDVAAPFTYPGDTLTASALGLSASMVSLNRNPSFFEFANARLGDSDLDGMLDYGDYLSSASGASSLDLQVPVQIGGGTTRSSRSPYVYFSGYEGAGYDPNDCNSVDGSDNHPDTALIQKFRVTLGISSGFTQSASPNPYTTGPAVPANAAPAAYQNANTFQLLSSGRDRYFGLGGQFTANGNPRLVVDTANSTPSDSTLRANTEGDNLTNFNSSKLE